MASPFGHALAGLAVGRAASGPVSERPAAWAALAACGLLALAPDLDFLPGALAGRPAAHHQGPSHSLFAALAVGALAAALFARRLREWLRWAAVFSLAYATHLALDWLGPDARPPHGIPLLWPFSDATFLSPLPLLPGVGHASSADVSTQQWLAAIFSERNARAVLVELALLLPISAAVEWWRRRPRAVRC